MRSLDMRCSSRALGCWGTLAMLLPLGEMLVYTELGQGGCSTEDPEQLMRYWYTTTVTNGTGSTVSHSECEAACDVAGSLCTAYGFKPSRPGSLAWCGVYGSLSQPGPEWGLANPGGDSVVTKVDTSCCLQITCYLKGPAWVFAEIDRGRCRGPGGWEDLVNSRYRLNVPSRAECEAHCVYSAPAGYGTCIAYSYGTTGTGQTHCSLYGEGVNNLQQGGDPDGSIIAGGWTGIENDASVVGSGFQLDSEDMECWVAFLWLGYGGCAGPNGQLVNARATGTLGTRSECATVCVQFGHNCHGFAWHPVEESLNSVSYGQTSCEIYGSDLQGDIFLGWSGLQRDTTAIGTTFEASGYDCFVKAPSFSDYDTMFSNCVGQWSECTAECETAGSRTWQQVTPQQGSGDPCPALSPACMSGEGQCVRFKAAGSGLCLAANGALPSHRYSTSIDTQAGCEGYCLALLNSQRDCIGYAWMVDGGQNRPTTNKTCYIFGSGVDAIEPSEQQWTGSDESVHTNVEIVGVALTRDPLTTCHVKEPWNEQPVDWEPPQACQGMWSPCTAVCERSDQRVWQNATAPAGWGRPCPNPVDCLPGDDECLCTRFSNSPSVEPDSCTNCTSGAAVDCISATCRQGFHSYANGTCCHTGTEVRSPGGCECIAGLVTVNAYGCGPAFACAAGRECISEVTCNSADDCVACGPGNWSETGSRCHQCPPDRIPNPQQSACEMCQAGKVPNNAQTRCESCEDGKIPNRGQTDCESCPLGKVPQDSVCIDCPAGTETSENSPGKCVCEEGTYSVQSGALHQLPHFDSNFSLPAIHCWNHDRKDFVKHNHSSCRRCDSSCLSCSHRSIVLKRGFQFLERTMPVGQDVHAFKCPIESACPEQILKSEWRAAHQEHRLLAQSCPMGSNYSYTGVLCASCAAGFRKGPIGTCSPCSATNGGLLSPFLLLPLVTVAAYCGFRKLFKHKRKKVLHNMDGAKRLFHMLDQDRDGSISRQELQDGLAKLDGFDDVDIETVVAIIEQIDLDHSGDIQEAELLAWMEQNQSRSEKSLAALKILLGLGQVLSKLPEVLKSDQLKRVFKDYAALNFFSFNFAWVFPVCEVDYISTFVLNTVALPGCLNAIVAATWYGNSQANEHHDEMEYNEQISRRSDYYFALFLSYPTMTQTFVTHLRCRDLGKMLRLEKDYTVDCSTREWQVLAIVSGLGIAFISVGVPLVIFVVMRKKWNELMNEVRFNNKPRVEAFRDFRRQYGYMSRDFRPGCYYAECVDLIRKLVLSGFLSIIEPGSVTQGFCSILLSAVFLAIGVYMWPYPSATQNLLKIYADTEIVLVSLIGMALRITDSSAGNFAEHATYILLVLLVCTIIPTLFALLYLTPVDRVQAALHKLAKDRRDDSIPISNNRPAARGRASMNLSNSHSSNCTVSDETVANPTFKAATHAVIATGRVRRATATDSVWVECRSQEHGNRPYWVNRHTRQSTWENPYRGVAAQPDEHLRRRTETATLRSSMQARRAPLPPSRPAEARNIESRMEVEV